jgi:hypothetical protein
VERVKRICEVPRSRPVSGYKPLVLNVLVQSYLSRVILEITVSVLFSLLTILIILSVLSIIAVIC